MVAAAYQPPLGYVTISVQVPANPENYPRGADSSDNASHYPHR